MKYTIHELAKLAKISPRTLRFYDQKGLLVPKRDKNSNYRVYDSDDASVLQHILICKAMGMRLDEIIKLNQTQNSIAKIALLSQHLKTLEKQKLQIELLVKNVENTIKSLKGEIAMSDKDKFEGLKDELLKKNDEVYKEEVIARWGNDAYQNSNQNFKKMSKETFDLMTKLNVELISDLIKITNEPHNESLKKLVALKHKEWITIAWGSYDRNAHLGVVEMYVSDERFRKYYDQHKAGIAQILKDAVIKYV